MPPHTLPRPLLRQSIEPPVSPTILRSFSVIFPSVFRTEFSPKTTAKSQNPPQPSTPRKSSFYPNTFGFFWFFTVHFPYVFCNFAVRFPSIFHIFSVCPYFTPSSFRIFTLFFPYNYRPFSVQTIKLPSSLSVCFPYFFRPAFGAHSTASNRRGRHA